ncbi:hypothetical protein C5L42_25345 [Pseudomonas aeruginosa]|nr:hypothetical protein C5L42_25345 [Pseudomonas aeruginosa]RQB20342.1 hypothetical protein IPC452_27205 [Pseudomonas aeruginosa]RQJ39355.1 hypothetical protein IPC1_28975 [Pseudomonas aeruginosa]
MAAIAGFHRNPISLAEDDLHLSLVLMDSEFQYRIQVFRLFEHGYCTSLALGNAESLSREQSAMRKEIFFRWLGPFTKAVTNEAIKTESPGRRALLR